MSNIHIQHLTFTEWRRMKGITQQQIGNMLGVTQKCISLYEKGERNFHPAEMLSLSVLLGIVYEDMKNLWDNQLCQIRKIS